MICNVSSYLFAPLEGLKELRADLQAFCKERGLKGTILLAPEGINLFVAGTEREIGELLDRLKGVRGLEALRPKISWSREAPFTRMLVRLKKEIIAFGVEGIEPHRYTSARMSAKTLQSWLDEGRDLLLLDTRNDYEAELGSFAQARRLPLKTFRDFPEAAASALSQEPRTRPVVTFCTGGIRCEKAAPLLEKMGFEQVYQLDGGILKYFEEVGEAHYQGECFVFDGRVGLDPGLEETESVKCFACLAALAPEERLDPRYKVGQSCPRCYSSPEEQWEAKRRFHQQELRRVSHPLPGSSPSESRKPLRIPGRLDRAPLLEALNSLFPQVPLLDWESAVKRGELLSPELVPADLDRQVRSGEEYLRVSQDVIEPDVAADIELLYEDEALIVVGKPAPLPVHSCGRFHRNTLRSLLDLVWRPESPRPAHRLDANTSGVLVCARTHHFAKKVQQQFARGSVAKRYLAQAHGHPLQAEWEIDLPITELSESAGLRAIAPRGEGLPSRTRVRVLERLADGSSLLEVEPLSGRTHQIRVHLWHEGHPVMGDPAYLPQGELGSHLTLEVGMPAMHLHCWEVALIHPVSGLPVSFRQDTPWAIPPLR